MGVYHLFWFRWRLAAGAAGRLLLGCSGSSSGTVTTAFLAFSSRAPSSVEPLSPQRTWSDTAQKSSQRQDPPHKCTCSFYVK